MDTYAGPLDNEINNPLPEELPLPMPGQRTRIPQLPYICGSSAEGRNMRQSIFFSRGGSPGVRLVDAMNQMFDGLDDRGDQPLGANCSGITIRIHFPGYPSSTEVERKLKELVRNGTSQKARSMQVSSKDYKTPMRNPITRSKLLYEVSKRIDWHIHDLLQNADLFPFDNIVGEQWRLEQGMQFEHMAITELESVSRGSWSPILWIDHPNPQYPGPVG